MIYFIVFPEMRTALRTYHPVPSLQKTDGNLQDAPRIKNILKSCFLHRERQNPLMTPADALTRSVCYLAVAHDGILTELLVFFNAI